LFDQIRPDKPSSSICYATSLHYSKNMKIQSLFIAFPLLLVACDVKVNNPPPSGGDTTIVNPPAKEEKTTIVVPPAEKKTESTTTTTTPDGTTTEKKTETRR
jgi:hypothetical protein